MFVTALLPLLIVPVSAVVLEKLAATPIDWTYAGAPASDQQMTLTVALPYQNVDQAMSRLNDVSSPSGGCYGNYMDRDDVDAMVQPSAETSHTVMSWLQKNGVSKMMNNGHSVSFATSVQNANKMLGAKFGYYKNKGVTKLRTTEYSVPDDVAGAVDFVHPTTFFGKTVAHMPLTPSTTEKTVAKRQVATSCHTSITPACVKELYNVGDYKPEVSSGSRIGFGSCEGSPQSFPLPVLTLRSFEPVGTIRRLVAL